MGTVTSPDDSVPPRNTKVTATWMQKFLPAGGQSVTDVGNRKHWIDTRADAGGMFRLCGVPVDNPISLSAGDGAGGAPVIVRIPANSRFARAELQLARGGNSEFTTFLGTVTDSAGQPLVAADVSLPALSKATATDATGAFRIEGIPAGMQHAVVRRLGYRAIDTSLTFSGDRTVHRRFELVRAVTLDSVVVTESAVDKRMESFEDNRRLGLGHFFTYEQLSQREGQSTGTILSEVPGAEVHGKGPHAWVRSSRSPALFGTSTLLDKSDQMKGATPAPCYAVVYIDNKPVFRNLHFGSPPRLEPLFDVNSIPVSEIEAIEFYASPAERRPNTAALTRLAASSSSTLADSIHGIRLRRPGSHSCAEAPHLLAQ